MRGLGGGKTGQVGKGYKISTIEGIKSQDLMYITRWLRIQPKCLYTQKKKICEITDMLTQW